MDVVEKINFLLAESGISKKEFALKLRDLEPRLISTGEIPSEQTIYRYLSGARELKIELIPYVAKVLNVSEQDLFDSSLEYSQNLNYKNTKELKDILGMFEYATKIFIVKVKEQLKIYKDIFEQGVKNIK